MTSFKEEIEYLIELINKQIKMKTSKVTRVNQVKPWDGTHGTIYFCQCEMDNGDKIEIGKKSEVQEGWELTYEIVDTQQEWNKAKAVQPEQGFTKSTPTMSPSKERSIVLQSCLKAAATFYAERTDGSPEVVFEQAKIWRDLILSE